LTKQFIRNESNFKKVENKLEFVGKLKGTNYVIFFLLGYHL